MTTLPLLLCIPAKETLLFLADNLFADGYSGTVTSSTQDALTFIDNQFAAAVIDSSLDDVGDLLSALAARTIPALMLCSTAVARVAAQAAGADALAKPFSYPEVRARVNALVSA